MPAKKRTSRSSRSSRKGSAKRRHGNSAADFNVHAYTRTLTEARAYLGAALDVKRLHDWDALRNSVWRLSQALHELKKAVGQLGRPVGPMDETVRDLDTLVKEMGRI